MICLVVYPTYWDPHPGVLQVVQYIVCLDLQLKDCFGWGRLIGNLCFKVVLSAKLLFLVLGIGCMLYNSV